jgi:hypothetical protein
MTAMCHLGNPLCLPAPMVCSHVEIGIVCSAEVCCYCIAMWHVSAEVDLSGPATCHVGGTHMSG